MTHAEAPSLANVTAIVLAGGKGTRIAGLYPNVPKPMIPIADRPFLHWVTAWLTENGIGDVVYSIGHLAHAVETWVTQNEKTWPGVRLRTIAETVPLGTGGAVCACLSLCSPWVLATNGDSLVKADLTPLFARLAAEELDGAIVGLPMDDASRYGSLDVDTNHLLRGFFEKRPGSALINGGVYVFKRSLLESFPADQPLSMETDIIPKLLALGARLAVLSSDQPFLDIGTPESVVLADDFIRKIFKTEA